MKPNLNTEGEIVNSYSSASCCYHRMPEVINLYRERVYFYLLCEEFYLIMVGKVCQQDNEAAVTLYTVRSQNVIMK